MHPYGRRTQTGGFKQAPVTPANVEARVEMPFHAHTKLDTVETLMQPRNKPTLRREEVDATREQAGAPPQPLAPTLLPYAEDDLLPGARQQRDRDAATSAGRPTAKPSGPPPPYFAAAASSGRIGAYDDDEDGDRDYVNVDTRRSPANSLERLDEPNSSARPLLPGESRSGPSTQPKPSRGGGRRSDAPRVGDATPLLQLADIPTAAAAGAESEYVNTLVERLPTNGRSRSGGPATTAQTRI